MPFLNAVTRYKYNGNRAAIDQVLDYMHDRAESRAVLPEDDAAVYIAIRALTITYAERLALKYDPAALPDYRVAVYRALGVDIFGGTDFEDFRVNAAAIRRFLGADDYEALLYALSCWMNYRNFERTTIVPALEHAFTRVELDDRSEREAVRYINRAFQTEYIRLLIAQNGTVRLGRRDADGQYLNVYVVPNKPEPWRILFEKAVTPEESALIIRRLTAKQRNYVQKAHEVVAADIESGQLSEYKVSEGGEYRIKMRYMAGRLGVEEDNLRKCFLKIRRKAAEIVPTIAY
jgi:hypothetical protein